MILIIIIVIIIMLIMAMMTIMTVMIMMCWIRGFVKRFSYDRLSSHISGIVRPIAASTDERLTFEECPIITLGVRLSIRGQSAKMAIAFNPFMSS